MGWAVLWVLAWWMNPALARNTLPSGARVISGRAETSDGGWIAGPHGVRYELKDHVQLRLAPDTRFRFGSSIRLELGVDEPARARVLWLESGRIDVTVPSRAGVAAMVSGPHKLHAVTPPGGHSVVVTRGDMASAAALHGDMLVGIDDKWRPLDAGSARTVSPKLPTGRTAPLPSAPKAPHLGQALLLKSGSELPSVEVFWTSSPEAVRYEVSLSPEREEGKTIRMSTTETKLVVPSVPAGVYRVRLRAVDVRGLESAAADGPILRILSVNLPKGAVVAKDGTILLLRHQSVELVGGSGLEISFGNLERFTPAPKSISLANHRPAKVTLRDPSTNQRLRFNIEPLNIKATIVFLSRTYWPEAGLPIMVRLFDAGGHAVPAKDLAVKIDTSVNVEPLKVHWTRLDEVLSTRLTKPEQPGPWVVRIEVSDRTGTILGRDFAELHDNSKKRRETSKERDSVAARD